MFLLDANIVSYFLQLRREGDLARAVIHFPSGIAEEVRQELTNAPQLGARFVRWLGGSGLGVLPILIGSKADQILVQLQPAASVSSDAGERASIALASADPSLIFVTTDKAASLLALRELWTPGERVLALQPFLRRLVDADALPGDAAEDVLRQSNQATPSWWPAWRSAR